MLKLKGNTKFDKNVFSKRKSIAQKNVFPVSLFAFLWDICEYFTSRSISDFVFRSETARGDQIFFPENLRKIIAVRESAFIRDLSDAFSGFQ